MKLQVRQIRPEEGLPLRALRLRALADAPMAFGSTLAREEAFPEDVEEPGARPLPEHPERERQQRLKPPVTPDYSTLQEKER